MGAIVKIEIPQGTPAARCKSAVCGATIYWVKTAAGKNMPVDADGAPHWSTCPDSKEFKAKAEAQRAYDKRVAEIRKANGGAS